MGKRRSRLLDEGEYLEREAAATERREFVHGVAYAMAGAGERHKRIALNLAVQLRMAARGTRCGVYVCDMKLRIAAAHAYYYPDVMASWEPAAPDAVFKETPCFLAEVLSPSTATIDTREKLHAYRGVEALRYYLVADSERVSVAYYVRGEDGAWLSASLDPGERLDIECGPLRAALSLDAIYEDTGLAV